MIDLNALPIAVAAVAAFLVSTMYYIAFAKQYAELRQQMNPNARVDEARPPAWKVLVELVRSAIVATVLAGFASLIDIDDWSGAVWLGLSVWVGFPVVLLVGSVVWDNVPSRLAAIHAGDWLIKILIITVVVSFWR